MSTLRESHVPVPAAVAPEEFNEFTYLYDGYATDTTILAKRRDITLLSLGDLRGWKNKRLRAAEEANNALYSRYAELAVVAPDTQYPQAVPVSEMLHSVLQNWKDHYFLPRVEEVGFEYYEEYADAKRIAELCGTKPLQQRGPTEGKPLYRALWNIHLEPELIAGDAFNLIVPPHLKVTGGTGDCRIYSWGALAINSEASEY